ncbi:MAG: hypothetical protein HYR66_06230 [Sphingobacteriales bacterium]|nr:hypothetical protein [Sphingobacteriales bacterium]MBI3718480.1 hypothetical protein [Sphingobacteriales bacterium]
MKKSILLSLLVMSTVTGFAQLKTTPVCGVFEVNVLKGSVNDVMPNFTAAEIKKKLPCFTSEEPEGKDSKCNGAVFYKDRDVSFYTFRDYIVIGPAFKGRTNMPVIGTKRNSLFNKLGNPQLKDPKWDAYQTQYGCLILYYDAQNKVNRIIMSTKGTDEIDLCQ